LTSNLKDQAVNNQLLAVVRPSYSTNLIVCFNASDKKAYARPDLPFGTSLSGRANFAQQHAHVMWFAEGGATWYLAHQDAIVRTIHEYITEHGIRRVKLFGGSAGGYAAIRMGLLVDQRLSASDDNVMLLSYSINPQTGFRPDLIRRVRQAVQDHRWNFDDIGKNPVLLSEADYHRYDHMKIDLRDLTADLKPRNFAAVVLSDLSNPIERAFCEDIASREYILIQPHHFGLGHAQGSARIWKEGSFWPAFESVYPFGTVDPVSGPQMLAFDPTLPIPSLFRRH
jgi:hypothetical protein